MVNERNINLFTELGATPSILPVLIKYPLTPHLNQMNGFLIQLCFQGRIREFHRAGEVRHISATGKMQDGSVWGRGGAAAPSPRPPWFRHRLSMLNASKRTSK